MKPKLLPAAARQLWQSSTVAFPLSVVRRICKKTPTASNKTLVEKCIKAGVAKRTASVTVSRWKKANKQTNK